MSEDNKGSKDGRSRAWTFIVYPDSAPENWREILDTKCIPWCESPLHDPDSASPEPAEQRKKHYHVVLTFEGKKSKEQIKEIIKELNCTVPLVVHNLRSLVRYFIHLDQPYKQQFALDSIVPHCGIDIKDYLVNKSDKYFYVKEMMEYIVDNELVEFHDFLTAAYEHHYDDWFPLLCDNCAFVINLFIKSYRHDPKRSQIMIDDGYTIDGKVEEVQ